MKIEKEKIVRHKEPVLIGYECDQCETKTDSSDPKGWITGVDICVGLWEDGWEQEDYCSAKCFFDAMSDSIGACHQSFSDLEMNECKVIIDYINEVSRETK